MKWVRRGISASVLATGLLLGLPSVAADAENVYEQWKSLRDTEAPLPPFLDAYQFLKTHPGWPQEKTIRARAEAAAALQNSASVVQFCADYPPITGRGMLACIGSNAGDDKQRDQWLHDAWRQGDFNADEEKRILDLFNDQLKPSDHLARLDRLLYEGKTAAAKRMYPLVTPPYRQLSDARIALITGAKNAIAKLQNVPKELRGHPGLILSRIEWRAKNDLDDGVVEMFLNYSAKPPYADRWWNLRASAVRQALREKKYDAALKILSTHGDLENENMADALFLEGWIRMEFKNDPRTGYKDFYALYKLAGTPVSKARAAYWAGRAAARNDNRDIALQWYRLAAQFSTVFYGQLAQHALNINASLELPPTPTISDATRDAMNRSEVVQAFTNIPESDARQMQPIFLKSMTEQASSGEEMAYIAELAKKNAGTSAAVKVAKWGLRKRITLIDAGWPMLDLPDPIGVEPALALAITRQESEFDPKARSGADARGYMQILPGTGAHVAKKLGLVCAPDDLWDGEKNITLGTAYLGQLIQGFDGSYILAIASYNAGPANVRTWIARSGWPPRDEVGAIDWVESIPYAETRNYVMRVLENLQIYRKLRDPNQPLDLIHDLTR